MSRHRLGCFGRPPRAGAQGLFEEPVKWLTEKICCSFARQAQGKAAWKPAPRKRNAKVNVAPEAEKPTRTRKPKAPAEAAVPAAAPPAATKETGDEA
mgnify:CR=1 FL=1